MTEIISVPEYYMTVCPCCLAKIKFDLKSIYFERTMNQEEITRGLIRCCNCDNEIPVAYNNKELTENVIADKYVNKRQGD